MTSLIELINGEIWDPMDTDVGAASGETDRVPLILTIPHAGETVPPEATWLSSLPEQILFADVDRYVDRLYLDAARACRLAVVMTHLHRYASDLNRFPTDVDETTVEGALNPAGSFTRGYLWQKTMEGDLLMPAPIPRALHEKWVAEYHDPFHRRLRDLIAKVRASGRPRVYHLDLHSMPSVASKAHPDPAGRLRPEIVVSDFEGRAATLGFREKVVEAFIAQGFSVQVNDPYKGGRITQAYGDPAHGMETIQIELRRDLYMNEVTKAWDPVTGEALKLRLQRALNQIVEDLRSVSGADSRT
jgi:N-formylglutamate deformylase